MDDNSIAKQFTALNERRTAGTWSATGSGGGAKSVGFVDVTSRAMTPRCVEVARSGNIASLIIGEPLLRVYRHNADPHADVEFIVFCANNASAIAAALDAYERLKRA